MNHAIETLKDVKSSIYKNDIKPYMSGYRRPRLLIILRRDEASLDVCSYVKSLTDTCQRYNVKVEQIEFYDINLTVVRKCLNNCDGFIVASDFGPDRRTLEKFLSTYTTKDIDAFLPQTRALWYDDRTFAYGRRMYQFPCVAIATYVVVNSYMERFLPNRTNKSVIIVNRSLSLGRPLAELFLKNDYAVSVYHSKSKPYLGCASTQQPDAVILAAGSEDWYADDLFYQFDVDGFVDVLTVNLGLRQEGGDLVGDFPEKELDDRNCDYVPALGGIGPITSMIAVAKLYYIASHWTDERRTCVAAY